MSTGFWGHAFDSLGDNIAIVGAVLNDVAANANPFSDSFASGDARATAAEVESQLARDGGRPVSQARIDASAKDGLARIKDAAGNTVTEVKGAAGDALDTAGKAAGGALDLLTNKWVLGGAAVVVVLIIAAPYLVPAVKAVAK